MFKFIVDGKDVIDNRINWKFKGTNLEFYSTEDKLERNIKFWRNKYKVGAEVEVEFLNVKKVEEDVNTIIAEPAIESSIEPNSSIVVEEPVVSQDSQDIADTPKRKTRKKTV
jgi:hypothetical protein